MQQGSIGRYQILEEIASGSQGLVYRAFDPQTNQIIALKVLHSALTSDRTYLERFHREARIAASIKHSNVVRIFEVGEDNGQHFISMEFVPENLARVIESSGPLPIESAARFTIQIAQGLDAAHRLGIVHRDVKPQNVLIGPDGIAKVTDFGIARAEALSTMTATGMIMGTPHYMSPEQAQGERVDVRSDVYSLGCVLYQMLAGDVPFQGTTPLAVLRQHVEVRPRSVRELRRDVPREVASVVDRAMGKNPSRRFQSMSEMATALRVAVPNLVLSEPQARPRAATAAAPAPQYPARTGTRGLRQFVYGAATVAAVSAIIGVFLAVAGIGFGEPGANAALVPPSPTATEVSPTPIALAPVPPAPETPMPTAVAVPPTPVAPGPVPPTPMAPTSTATSVLPTPTATVVSPTPIATVLVPSATVVPTTTTTAVSPSPTPTDTSTPLPSASPTPLVLGELSGMYAGEIHNTTFDISSTITLHIQQLGGSISGEVEVFPPLNGDGPIQGSVIGDQLDFTVSFLSGGIPYSITFIGEVLPSGTLRGVYNAVPTGEKGTWEVSPDE